MGAVALARRRAAAAVVGRAQRLSFLHDPLYLVLLDPLGILGYGNVLVDPHSINSMIYVLAMV